MHTFSGIFQGGRCGPKRKFKSLDIFAYDGMVVIVDKEGNIDWLTATDAYIRAVAVYNEWGYKGRNLAEERPARRQDWKETQAACENLVQCAKEAKEMGDPTDPVVQAFRSRHASKSRVGALASTSQESDVERFHSFKGAGGKHKFHQSVYQPRKFYRPLKK